MENLHGFLAHFRGCENVVIIFNIKQYKFRVGS